MIRGSRSDRRGNHVPVLGLIGVGVLVCTFALAVLSACTSAGEPKPISLSKDAVTLAVGSSYQLTSSVQDVTWKSSDGTVATVSSSGLVTGVSRGKATITATSGGTTSAGSAVTVASIYIPGAVWSASASASCYWKDGKLVTFSPNSNYWADMIAVAGDAVYLAGHLMSDGTPAYVKNGSWAAMTGQPEPNNGWWYTGMAVSGSDVYVTGVFKLSTPDTNATSAGYWKNGVWQNCTGIVTSGEDSGVVVAGGHIYMAGYDTSGRYATPQTPTVPVYWIDGGQKGSLPLGGNNGCWLNGGAGYAAIAASGNDVYIAGNAGGSAGDVPIVWKNQQVLSQGTSGNYWITSMSLNGSDVYLAGLNYTGDPSAMDTCSPVVWKNGVSSSLPYTSSMATAMFVAAGADVYVVGKPTGPDPDSVSPLVWKNGASLTLAYPAGDNGAWVRGAYSVGNDVFLVGITGTVDSTHTMLESDSTHPVYWKNGELQQLDLGGFTQGSEGWAGAVISMP